MYKKVILLVTLILAVVLALVFTKRGTILEDVSDGKDEDIKNELFKAEDEIEKILNTMTLEEKVTQMFIVRCPEEGAEELIQKYNLGGYILFAKDFNGKTNQDVINMINGFQEQSKIPMIIAVDEEGGTVCRVSQNSNLRETKFKSPQELYNEGGYERIYADAIEKSELLLSLGINMNLAPVADVVTNNDDYMYKRSFGKNAEETCKYIQTVVKAMKSKNIGCSLKHFPGYGNNKDSHKEMTYDSRSIQEFESIDFLPFKAGIENGADSILVSHNIVVAIDKDYPASLSKKMHDLLREKLGFTGLIITDDLAMSGAKGFAGIEELAVMAVEAGNDLIITSDFEIQKEAVIEGIKNGIISEEKINEAVKRILTYKQRNLGIR